MDLVPNLDTAAPADSASAAPADTAPDRATRRQARMREDQRRLVTHLADGTTDMAPEPIWHDPAVYTDPALAKREQQQVFRKLPLLVGLSQDVARPGDTMLFEAAGPPIFIARGRDGVVRGFLNMCRHRGARLVEAGAHRSTITCPYHAWSYDLEGKLSGVPCSEAFEPIDRSKLGLYRVPTAEWGGMIFVEASPSEAPLDIAAHLGAMAPELEQLELGGAVLLREDIVPSGGNWKYALDTNFEGYHFASLHPKTVMPTHASNREAFTRYGRHHRINFARHSWNEFVGKPESEWPELPYESLQFLFPNSLIQTAWLADGAATGITIHNNYPGPTPDTSFNVLRTYRGAKTDPKYDDDVIALHAFVVNVLTTEDYLTATGAHRNIQTAPAEYRMILGRNEIAMHYFHKHLREVVGAG